MEDGLGNNEHDRDKPPTGDEKMDPRRHGFRHNRWKGSGGQKWRFWHHFGPLPQPDGTNPEGPQQVSLCELTVGEDATILGFHGWQMVKKRLASLGFTPGVKINMVQNYGLGTADRLGARHARRTGTRRSRQDHYRAGEP